MLDLDYVITLQNHYTADTPLILWFVVRQGVRDDDDEDGRGPRPQAVPGQDGRTTRGHPVRAEGSHAQPVTAHDEI